MLGSGAPPRGGTTIACEWLFVRLGSATYSLCQYWCWKDTFPKFGSLASLCIIVPSQSLVTTVDAYILLYHSRYCSHQPHVCCSVESERPAEACRPSMEDHAIPPDVRLFPLVLTCVLHTQNCIITLALRNFKKKIITCSNLLLPGEYTTCNS